ncbi:hypothetical protein GCM10011352_33740 [Marinobacterium zhoushanense]|uniref:Uncharacterized protein n=1 Tax=Marinobacterium zhoushanense TaxID=1679163 RepID=A0ABQ1KQ26_9GAMM|nr:hypothetical protein [Marinobacterium zhoushanense]GGC04820.1 hypothetical protein GCM10011352_33740 [Marinobacterium zhoushanense]
MTLYLRKLLSLSLASLLALLLSQVANGSLADERYLNSPVLAEGAFDPELQGRFTPEPDQPSVLPENAKNNLSAALDSAPVPAPVLTIVCSPLTLPPSRAPPPFI